MPQIPVVLSEHSIPGQTGSPFMSGEDAVGSALARSGQQIQNVANRYQTEQWAVQEKIKNAERHVEASKHENDIKFWIEKQAEGFKGRQDYQNFEPDIEKMIADKEDEIDKIPDVMVRSAVKAAAQNKFFDLRKFGIAKKDAVLSDQGKASLDQNLAYDLQEAVSASSEPIYPGDGTQEGPPISERGKIRGRMEARIMAAAGAGIIHEADAVNMIQKLDGALEMAYALRLKSTDPARLLKELDEKGTFPNIGPVEKERLRAEVVGSAKEQLATNELLKLKTEIPDIQARLAKIESPEYLKSLGAHGAEIQNTLLSYTLREWKIKEDAYKKTAENKIGKISIDIYNGRPVAPQDLEGLQPPELALVEKIRDYQVRQDRAELNEQFRIEAAKRAEKSAERAEARQARYDRKIEAQEKSDSIEGDIIKTIIDQGPVDVTKDIYGQIPNGLTVSAANRLIGMLTKTQKDPSFKLGADVIEKAFQGGTPADKAARGRMLIDFRQQVDDEKATGKRIIDIAEALAAPKKKSKVGEWLNGLWTDIKQNDLPRKDGVIVNQESGQRKGQPGKIVGTKGGKNVYELPDGKWQVGE